MKMYKNTAVIMIFVCAGRGGGIYCQQQQQKARA